jgi:flagellar hook-length control protein FliK
MQTPAILNLSNAASSATTTAKPAGNASSSAFNQMLSQQIAERRDNTPPRSSPATQAPASSKSPQAKPAAQSAKSEAKQNDKADSAKEADGSEQERTESSADAGIPPTATELLAQAASALLRQQASEVAPADGEADTGVRDLSADGAARTGKRDLLMPADAALRNANGNASFMASLQEAVDVNAARDMAQDTDGRALEKLSELTAAKTPETPAIAGAVAQMQPGMQELAQLAAGKTSDRLTPHVGTPAWDQALGQKVVWMVGGAQQSASLSLNPPDLGPLQIVLNVSNGQADASFYAAQPEVRQALEAALPRLRDMMGEAGVQLGQASVSAGMPDRHDQPGERFGSQGNGGPADKAGNDAQAAVTRVTPITQGQGLVDTFV